MCSVELVTPATLVDLADVFGRGDPGLWVTARRQLALGPTHAIRDAAGALVVGGYVPDGDWLEAWFWVHPRAARHMPAIVRAVRLTLRDHGEDRVYAVMRSDAGRRIARALGFRPATVIDNVEIWTHG